MNDCICPDGKCHHGRKIENKEDHLCGKCIALWFDIHLKARVRLMLAGKEAEAKWIAMRSLLQFLGISSKLDRDTGTLDLEVKDYWLDELLSKMRGGGKVTYEVRAANLGGESFDDDLLSKYKTTKPDKANLLASFLFGVNVHTAHLKWGANHSDKNPTCIWDTSNKALTTEVAKEICELLHEHVYEKCGKQHPWNAKYEFHP